MNQKETNDLFLISPRPIHPSAFILLFRTRSMTQPVIDLRPYFTALDEVEGVLDWSEVFGNSRPVELDIGCGRGMFLFDSTINHPETNWLGLELDFTQGRPVAKRLAKRENPNVQIIGGDA